MDRNETFVHCQLAAQKFLIEILLANFLDSAPNDEWRNDFLRRLKKSAETWPERAVNDGYGEEEFEALKANVPNMITGMISGAQSKFER